jgi:membrane protease YdiL (CAAX protease family)
MNEKISNQNPKRRVVYFLIALTLLTLGTSIFAIQLQGSPIASLLIMWTPALAAIVVSLLVKRPLKEIGWNLRPVKWLALAWAIPILYGFAAYAPLWLTGLGAVPNPTFLERARLTLNLQAGSDAMVILSAFGFITLINLIPSMVFSLGEEIGWRGFLVPELSKWINLRKAGLLSGLIWAGWHLPGILSGEYGTEGTPFAYQLLCFTVMVVSSGMLFAWIRIKSGSLWPAVILHAVHNNVIQSFFDRITADTGHTGYFTGEFGLMPPVVMAVIGWLCWKGLGTAKQPASETLKAGVLAKA